MKKLLLPLLLLPTLLFAQSPDPTEQFTILGHIGHLNAPSKAYLLYQLGATKVIDSAQISDGTFSFNGRVLYPESALLVLDHDGKGIARILASQSSGKANAMDALNFYADKGILMVDGKDSVATAKISGSTINTESDELKASLAPIQQSAMQLSTEMNSATPERRADPTFMNGINARAKMLQDQQKGLLETFAATHRDSYLSLIIINQLGPHTNDPNKLEKLLKGLAPALQNSEPGKVTLHAIQQAEATGIGSTAPDFTQNDVNGSPVTLSSFRGKYVLIDFWASWCGPCREENPNVVRTYKKYKDKNFTIIGVSLDRPEGRTAWLNAIKSDGLNWTQVSDLNFWSNKVAVQYFINEIPSNFLIDPKGKIIARNLRGEELDQKLAQVLNN
jgi:peroxiredoxin